MIKKLTVYLMSVVAGMFGVRGSDAFLRHDWWVCFWDLALVIGWSAVVWHHLSTMEVKEAPSHATQAGPPQDL